MQIRRVSGPEVEPLTLDEVRDHLNFDSTDKDELLDGYIRAARAYVEGQCHIIVAESLFEASSTGFPSSPVEIDRFPLISVESIKYDDEDGDEQTLGEDAYFVDTAGPFSRIYVGEDGWPATNGATNSVRIRFWAGYPMISGSSPEALDIPQDLKQAMLIMVGFFFANRDGAAGSNNDPPPAVEALIGHHRVPVIA